MNEPKFLHDETQEFVIDENLAKVYPTISRTDLLKWLVSAPKKTYLRVNSTTTSVKELFSEIIDQSNINIEIHNKLSDSVIVASSENKSNEDKTDLSENIVIVGSGCAASILRGAEIFAPGVLGASPYLEKNDPVSVYADLSNKLLKGAIKFDITNYLYVGNGVANLSRSDLFKEGGIQSGVAVTMTSTFSRCSRLNDVKLEKLKSKYLMQNLPSILTTIQLEIQPNDRCLDLCAAPGGKTTHIASLLGNEGSVLAFDKSKAKIDQIQAMARRLGVAEKITAKVQDATKYELDCELFDKVLLDAPCSALGQRPMLINSCTAKELKSFPKLQRKLFEKAVELVKPNGILVYSTCTITIEENEGLVNWALEKFKDRIQLCQTSPVLGQPGFNMYEEASKVQRFGPNEIESDNDDSIGFFIAKFKKLK